MEKEEIEKAKETLGIEDAHFSKRIARAVGRLAIILAIILFVFVILGVLFPPRSNNSNYPHVRSPYVPRNRFLALVLLNIAGQPEYGVFSRGELLGNKMPG
ncbi:MAG: hypothetical protein ACXACI_16000 [Candidatus Hodarchaeales archaeon]